MVIGPSRKGRELMGGMGPHRPEAERTLNQFYCVLVWLAKTVLTRSRLVQCASTQKAFTCANAPPIIWIPKARSTRRAPGPRSKSLRESRKAVARPAPRSPLSHRRRPQLRCRERDKIPPAGAPGCGVSRHTTSAHACVGLAERQ